MRILIIRFSSIGDIILTEPVVRLIKEYYPNADIDYLTKPQFKQIPALFSGIHDIYGVTNISEIRKQISVKKYDLIIDLQGKINSFLVRKFFHSSRSVSYNKMRLARQRIVHRKTGSIGSTVALYLTIFDKLGHGSLYDKQSIDVPSKLYPTINLPLAAIINQQSSILLYYREIRKLGNEKIIAIALFPGALHKTKQYPPSKFATLIDSLSSDRYRFYILGSASESKLADQINNQTKVEVENWCGKFDLYNLALITSAFDIIITNDSGPMHLAAALSKKQLAIFGATSPRLGFKPHNEQGLIIQEDLPCRPCSLHGGKQCPLKHFNCMQQISSDKLVSAINTLISKP